MSKAVTIKQTPWRPLDVAEWEKCYEDTPMKQRSEWYQGRVRICVGEGNKNNRHIIRQRRANTPRLWCNVLFWHVLYNMYCTLLCTGLENTTEFETTSNNFKSIFFSFGNKHLQWLPVPTIITSSGHSQMRRNGKTTKPYWTRPKRRTQCSGWKTLCWTIPGRNTVKNSGCWSNADLCPPQLKRDAGGMQKHLHKESWRDRRKNLNKPSKNHGNINWWRIAF